jgi:general secretion pathway protein K
VRPPVPRRERGAALLAVLLLVAIMGAIAAAAFERLRLSTALAVNSASLDQARAYAVGVETLLAVRADDVAAEDPEATTLRGGWNGTLRRIPLPAEGLAEGTIRDGGNCFNLNSLVQGEAATGLSAREAGIVQFANLMRVLGVAERDARRIAEAASDWADSDSLPSAGGAEDSFYADAPRPYRAANTLFAEVSELRAVAGMTPEVYARLRPYLCALPVAELSPINVNTLLPQQAPLLAMLAPEQISLDAARTIIARQPPTGWRRLEDFWRQAGARVESLPLDLLGQLQLSTRWFAIELRVAFNGAELIETALVDARFAPARVVVRRWGRDD